MSVQVERPRNVDDVSHWLRHYLDWQGELESAGYYAVTPELGSKVQSNRQGRPTENAAIRLAVLAEQCRTVEQWLNALDPVSRRLADHYVRGVPVAALQREAGLSYDVTWGVARGLPTLIWARWYGGE